MNQLFKNATTKIEGYKGKKYYKLGWRFLNCSQSVLQSKPLITLITSHPGGDSNNPDHPSPSCEEKHSYLFEKWDKRNSSPDKPDQYSPGQHPLQIQIQQMFKMMFDTLKQQTPNQIPGISSHTDLLVKSLSGHFIPFRSPSSKELPRKKEVSAFATELWREILPKLETKYIICLGQDTHKGIQKAIPNTPPEHIESLPTGWGKLKADISTYSIYNKGEKSQIKLLRLPHLSHFRLFSQDNDKKSIKESPKEKRKEKRKGKRKEFLQKIFTKFFE